MAVADAGWSAAPSQSSLALGPGARGVLTIAVAVPADAVPGERRTALVTLTSQANPAASDSAALATTAAARRHDLMLPLLAVDPNPFYRSR